jgi:cell division septation protein DedD
MAVRNETWLVALIVVLAGILLVMSLAKQGPQAPSSVTASVELKPAHATAPDKAVAAVRPVSGVVEEPKVDLPRDTFAVQVFSFKEKARAEVGLKMLKDKGYPAYVMMSDLGPRGIFYRVRVGSFTTDEEARKNLESVIRDFKSGIIVSE